MSRRVLAAVLVVNLAGATYVVVDRVDDSQPVAAVSSTTTARVAPPPSLTTVPVTTAAPTTAGSDSSPVTTVPPASPVATETVPAAPATAVTTPAPDRRVEGRGRLRPFRGLGTWVDVFDFSRRYMQEGEASPVVTPERVDEMADRGVRTLYIQASRDDPRTPGLLESPRVLGRFLVRAHARGMQVVAWYLPKKYDRRDLERLRAMREFRVQGQGFDAIGVDIEFRADVPDLAERNRRLVELSRRLREESGSLPLAAVVLPPVVTDIINPRYWPEFPWRELAPVYDAWLPMAYWTTRSAGSEWRDAHRYVTANVTMVRRHLGDLGAPVHPIGGIGDRATRADYRGFVRAARETGSIGASVYDFRTTAPAAWPILQRL